MPDPNQSIAPPSGPNQSVPPPPTPVFNTPPQSSSALPVDPSAVTGQGRAIGSRGRNLNEAGLNLIRQGLQSAPSVRIPGGKEEPASREVATPQRYNPETYVQWQLNQGEGLVYPEQLGRLESERNMAVAPIAAERIELEKEVREKSINALRDWRDKSAQLNQWQNDTIRKLQTAEIDPNRWWRNATVGQQIIAAIGVALSATVSKAGENEAVNRIDKLVDADVQQQLTNIDIQRKNLTAIQQAYLQAKEMYGDEKEAIAFAHDTAMKGVLAKMESAAAPYESAILRKKAEETARAYAEKVLEKRLEMERKDSTSQTLKSDFTKEKILGGGPNKWLVDKGMELAKMGQDTEFKALEFQGGQHVAPEVWKTMSGENAPQQVALPGIGRYELPRNIPANEAEKVRARATDTITLNKLLGQLEKYADADGIIKIDPRDKQRYDTLQHMISATVNTSIGMGAMNNEETATWSRLIGRGSLGGAELSTKAIRQLRGNVNDRMESMLQASQARRLGGQ